MVARMRDASWDIEMDLTAETLAAMRPAAIDSVNEMIRSFEEGENWTPSVPPEVAKQIKSLARQGASLEALIRSFAMVGGVFMEFLVSSFSERRAQEFLQYLAAWQGRNGDRLMNAFTTEYTNEVERLAHAPDRRIVEQVKKILGGGSAANVSFDYPLEACHVGLVAVGAQADRTCRTLAERLGCELLLVHEDDETVWAWVGARRRIEVADLERLLAADAGAPVVAAGEPRDGVAGWRLTHHEAGTALPVAHLEGPGLTRCSNVALLAYALCDEAVGRSLLDRYLRPLEQHRDSAVLRETLRAYFELDCNAASAASSLGVNRHTIQRRLSRVEQTIGESLASRRSELDVALRLEGLTGKSREPELAAAS